jgi:uncharacterized protein YrrD
MAVHRPAREALDMEVEGTVGYEVADASGSRVGRVESTMHGTTPDHADAVAVRGGRLLHRHYLVPSEAIRFVDRDGRLIELRLDRSRLRRFL